MTDKDVRPVRFDDVERETESVGDPAQAFDALRQTVEDFAADLVREMTTIRKGVEAAFDDQEKRQQPIDYSADIALIIQSLLHVAQLLEAIEESPPIKHGHEHYLRTFERSGESLVRTAALQFQNESRDFQRVTRDLVEHLSSAREREAQNHWLWMTGLAGVVVGAVATLFLPRLLPGSVAPVVASIVMAKSPWHAGMELMAYDSWQGWERVSSADQLFETNREELAACRQMAIKVGKDQTCTITVPAVDARNRRSWRDQR
jgi:hypothetical protein